MSDLHTKLHKKKNTIDLYKNKNKRKGAEKKKERKLRKKERKQNLSNVYKSALKLISLTGCHVVYSYSCIHCLEVYSYSTQTSLGTTRFPIWVCSTRNTMFYGLPVYGNSCTKVSVDAGGQSVTANTRTFVPDTSIVKACTDLLEKILPKVCNVIWTLEKLEGKVSV